MPERCKAWKTMKLFPTLHTAPWKTPMLPASPTFPQLSMAMLMFIKQKSLARRSAELSDARTALPAALRALARLCQR